MPNFYWGQGRNFSLLVPGAKKSIHIMRYYKNLSLGWGVDRKIGPWVTVWHHEACQVTSDWFWGTDFFYLSPTPMIETFSCIPFISEGGIFDNAVSSIADVCHIVMTIPWLLVTSCHSVTSTFPMAYHDFLYNQCISNLWTFSSFILPTGQIRVCEIRFASKLLGVICRNPYPVYKKCLSYF